MASQTFTAASMGALFDQLVSAFDGRAVRVLEAMQQPAQGGVRFDVDYDEVIDKPGETTRTDWQIFMGEIKWRTTTLDENGMPVLA